MATDHDAVADYEPTGDPDHVAYGADYYWTCTCGASANFFTAESKARYRAEQHEQYCRDNGTATIRVAL